MDSVRRFIAYCEEGELCKLCGRRFRRFRPFYPLCGGCLEIPTPTEIHP